MPDTATVNPEAELEKYGAPRGSVLTFSDTPHPELIDYLDFTDTSRRKELRPDGVVESQGKPLLYYVNASRLAACANEEQETELLRRRTLASRGQRAYLAVVRHGQLDVVPVSLDERTPEWKVYRPGTGEAITFFSRLALGEYDGKGEPKHADLAFEAMFRLLKQAGEQLAGRHGLDRGNVLSLIGRALFFRFLVDRQVVEEGRDRPHIAPKAANLYECFDSAENAAATCAWLDGTFNGDFLPLSRGGSKASFREIGNRTRGEAFRHLQAIMLGWSAVGGGTYQPPFSLDWSDFDFAHVPVGLLSQVYEAFCWEWEPHTARTTSVYYTPRNIAATLVEEVFENLTRANEARVLDPACGGGVFLVLAFRRLYRALWQTTGQRPDTKAIRRILEGQLTGFDISESAIRLTALSLYLTAVELDPDPIPPEKLRFKPLRDKVLFNLRRKGVDPDHGPVAGSLGDRVPQRFHEHFDVVLSNPPWTPLSKTVKNKENKEENKKEEKRIAALALEFTEVSRAVISGKGETELAAAYQNPDKDPDLPILLKSTEWCKPDGRIAMALPSRILLKQQDVPKQAREALLQLIEVTGIINGSNLADTRVWPAAPGKESKASRKRPKKMGQPFMLLFARNRRPKPGHTVQFISPQCDVALNSKGELWIDSKSAQPVEVDASFQESWLWKALSVGTSLDIALIRKMNAAQARALQTYWEEDLHLLSDNGYQIRPDQPQDDASHLHKLPNLDSTKLFSFAVDTSKLSLFTRPTARWPRTRDLYRAPLALVKVSPGKHRQDGRALLSLGDVAFNESYYGYSAAGHPEGELLARYVHLFVHSSMWAHYALVVSPEFGAERRKLQKRDLDNCPIVPLSSLSPEQKRTLMRLSRQLVETTAHNATLFSEIDRFFGALYGLDQLDLEVIHDTLEVSLPYADFRKRACQRPNAKEQSTFRERLEGLLAPFFKVVGQEPVVELRQLPDTHRREKTPFGVLAIGKRGQKLPETGDFFLENVVPLATQTGQTLIVQESQGGLLVAIRNQYRYWTPTRARLLAADILRNRMAPFEG